MDSSSDERGGLNRAPRKRAIDGVARTPRKGVVKRAPRKRATRKSVKEEPVRERVEKPVKVAKPVERKAPTPIASSKAGQKRKRKQKMIAAALVVFGVAASAAIGYLDQGQIDVQKTIEERNERIRNNRADDRDVIYSQVEIPVQDTSQKTNEGLVGRGTGGRSPAPVVVEATSTATSTGQTVSSTDATASSTETGTEEEQASTTEEDTVEEEIVEEAIEPETPAETTI